MWSRVVFPQLQKLSTCPASQSSVRVIRRSKLRRDSNAEERQTSGLDLVLQELMQEVDVVRDKSTRWLEMQNQGRCDILTRCDSRCKYAIAE